MMGRQEWWIRNPSWSYSTYTRFSGENCIWSPWLLFISKWVSLDTSGETASWITLVCPMFCWYWFVYWWYRASYFIIIIYQQNAGTFSDDKCSSKIDLLSHEASVSFVFWTPFLFFSTFFTYQLDFFVISLSFDVWIFSHLLTGSELSDCCLCAFGCCECWLPWNMSCTMRVANDNFMNNFDGNIF